MSRKTSHSVCRSLRNDFTALSGSVTICRGNSYVDVTVSALEDNLVEGDEDLEVTITAGNYTIDEGVATLVIADDPPVVSVARLADGEEGGSDGTFRVSRSGGDISEALVVTYTVGGSAVGESDEDYVELTGTVTISSSASYTDIVIDVTDDGDAESTETVTMTLDTDEDWINGSATDTLFIWDDEGTFVYWTGAEDDAWMNADNWSGNAVPDSDDIVVFDGTHDDDVTLSGPLSPYSIGELRIATGYTGTITLSFPLSVGSLSMAGGTIDQPYSGYGSDLTVTSAALWTGGELNSTANVADVVFDGATVLIAPSDAGTVYLGSNITVENGAAGTIREGTIELINCEQQFTTTTGSNLVVDPGSLNQTTILQVQPELPMGGYVEAGSSWTLMSGTFEFPGAVGNAGTITLNPSTVFSVLGDSGTDEGYVQWGGGSALYLLGGSTLKSLEPVIIQGGTLATVWAEATSSGTATIVAPSVIVSGGDIYVCMQAGLHVNFGALIIGGHLTWSGGTYHPYVYRGGGSNDVWRTVLNGPVGTFAISGGTIAAIYRIRPADR